MDGVTTALELEIGVSPVNSWYDARAGRALVNFGASAGHIPARTAVMKETGEFLPRDAAMNRWATSEEQRAIAAAIQKGLDEGALGIGLGLAYSPSATAEEILDLFYLAAKWKRVVFVHVRDAGTTTPGIVESLQEVIGDAAASGASLHIVHIGSMAQKKTPEALRMIEGARMRGLDVTTEAYPYIAGSTSLESAMFEPARKRSWGVRSPISFGRQTVKGLLRSRSRVIASRADCDLLEHGRDGADGVGKLTGDDCQRWPNHEWHVPPAWGGYLCAGLGQIRSG
jgi:N-acyl-D-aspartate/D-glutamate deacylase